MTGAASGTSPAGSVPTDQPLHDPERSRLLPGRSLPARPGRANSNIPLARHARARRPKSRPTSGSIALSKRNPAGGRAV